MTVLLIDWLGRGGIAQVTEAWFAELSASGASVMVATRPGRELGSFAGEAALAVPDHPGKLRAHRAVVSAAATAIADVRPDTVVIQNYVVPALERKVYRAAARAGARVILVIHDHRLHARLAGNHAGLRRCIRDADVVVTHTRFVARAVTTTASRNDVLVLPHPVGVGMLQRPRPSRPPFAVDGPLALHFGALQRHYKGTSTVVDLARSGVDGWRFGLIGQGAPPYVKGAEVFAGFADSGTLVSAVKASHATLLPYTYATQSGAVVLAQALGSAVLVSAVGGIPEQVEHGVTGFLLPPGAPVEEWRRALAQLGDSGARDVVAATARRRAWENHAVFVDEIRKLVA